MKKYFFIVFILVASIFNGGDLKIVLDSDMNTNSMNISHHNHIDDMFELVVADKNPEHATYQIIAESSHVFFQENHNKIWKPPVNS